MTIPVEEFIKAGKPTRFKSGSKLGKAIATKGGKSKSVKKSIGAKIRWLKEAGLTDKKLERLTAIMDDPRLSIIDMQLYNDKIAALAKGDPKLMTALATHKENLHKLQHGDKKQIDIRSVNLNLVADESMTEKFLDELGDHFGDE